MKRSKMIDVIQLELETQSRYGGSYRFRAQMILEKIEEAGMVPPDTGKGHQIVTVNPTGTVDHSKHKDYRWEEEDHA